MDGKPPRGLFITGNNTGVGKTHVAGLIAGSLRNAGLRVGTYKPAASGLIEKEGQWISEDVHTLWESSGKIWDPRTICPQTFHAPLAPHLSARAEGKVLDTKLLRTGFDFWRQQQAAGACDLILVEGAGGLLSPMSDDDYVADLALEFGLPLVIVAANRLGMINETLQTVITARFYQGGVPIAGIILNDIQSDASDVSRATNRTELARRCPVPILTHVPFGACALPDQVNWLAIASMT
ncbi:ATP-dependent dethiobiotin synthetase BioD 1 [Bremerella volcania]|uniref:ATP-dependent dethiobiotin synthetase BioD n=1 Tax=Bremerella volcania TaxID=2527984 RepID=A0A518C1X4_9BACT|nr:dethiobiotin synthase [Bremerella volcania]QDU73194.1 ATP-dependent dethiobiotin synthetase BioD 1 [Bremerella volcania]